MGELKGTLCRYTHRLFELLQFRLCGTLLWSTEPRPGSKLIMRRMRAVNGSHADAQKEVRQ